MPSQQEDLEDFYFSPDEDGNNWGVRWPSSKPRSRRRRTQYRSSPFSSPSKSLRDAKISKSNNRSTTPPALDADRNDSISFASRFALDKVIEILQFTFGYLVEVFRSALDMLRIPLAIVLVCFLFGMLIVHLGIKLTTPLYPAIATLCHLPVISRASFCHKASLQELMRPVVQRADYPRLVDIQSATFEKLLQKNVGGTDLALDIKKAEMATVDLQNLVQISHLTSKDRMADVLGTFAEDAKRTGRGLQKFNAKVRGAVDRIMAVNDYALKRIEEAAAQNSNPSIWRAILSPISFQPSPHALTTSFKQSMSILESELHSLILIAQASVHDLDTLEEQLNLIHSMVVLEDDSISASKDELLSKLWTLLGGNRAELRRFDNHLNLLSGLTDYRKKARIHVIGALQTLETMNADLEALRERVSQPLLTIDEPISLDVHVKSIRIGLNRLAESTQNAKLGEDARYAKLAKLLSIGN